MGLVKQKFEDYETAAGKNDILEKARQVHEILSSGKASLNDALGAKLLCAAGPEVELLEKDGRRQKAIMLGSNSYFNFTTNPQVIQGAQAALDKYGYGMGAVSVYAGITELHQELESLIAEFYGCEDAIVFPNGYGCNVGIISALCGEGDVIINDSANHASIFDGSKLSGAEVKVYPHANMNALERILAKIPDSQKGRLIITDGVFSMHGDVAPLDKLVQLAKKYNARVMVDDGHGLGIMGPTGRGSAEHFGVMKDIDLHVGMLSKTPGAVGGYCAAGRDVIQYLKLYARSYFFSTALPAPVVGGLVEVFKIMIQDKAGRRELWENINYLKSLLLSHGFNLGRSNSGIVPVIVGDEAKLIDFYKDLKLAGVYTNIVSYPAVRRKECRIRICVMKELTKEQLKQAADTIAVVGKKYGVI
ncbi:MAG: aminotransferase class I/II-fold pyridoxal phosphate-dependent enzyme [Heliobacteriaceae bacterium]|jgi:glycine C-acetyltransferase|nr:aminotransferase class I/II-fold pyridoxal phosphate-dependent enzyme [Heliobacteriaceae bacterium]